MPASIFRAHTATHSDLRKPYDKVAKKKLEPGGIRAWLENEIGRFKQTIEQKLGVKVNCFAVPYGFHNDQVRDVAMKAGYEALFTVYGQPITMHTPLNSVGRYLMEANKPKTFTDAVPLSPRPRPAPPFGGGAVRICRRNRRTARRSRIALPLIKANIASLGAIDPGTVPRCGSAGWGWSIPAYDPKSFDRGLSGDAATERQDLHRHREREIGRQEGGDALDL